MTEVGQPDLDLLTKQPVNGTLLADRLAEGPLSAEEALQYAIDIGSQLNKAHSRGMVHGCLSPYSIRITESGAQVLFPPLNPGAKTAAYRAPEQVRGDAPDSRSDVFAFGAILYEMAAGMRAFHGEGPELNRSILQDPAPLLTLRSPIYDAMASVIGGCLEKSPTARRQRVQNAVIELRFAAKASSMVAGVPRPAKLPAPAPLPPPLPAPKARPLEPPRAEQFFFKPGEPVLKMHSIRPNWQRLFHVQNKPTLAGFRLRLWAFIGACMMLLAGVGLGAVMYFRPRPVPPVLKFAVAPPEHTSYPGSASVSPDGRYLAFSLQGPEGQRMLWLRPLDALRQSPITGTEGASNPFWSPDSQSIAYFAGRALKMVRIRDGFTETICKVEGSNGGGTWNSDGIILFSRNIDDGLYQVPAKAGSTPTPVLKLNPLKGEDGYLWPQFLPDEKHFLFFIQTETADTTGVYAGALDANDYRMLFPSETNALYSALPGAAQKNGYLLYIADRKLMGQGFNAPRLGLAGEPITLADDIGAVSSMNLAPISVAHNATLVYYSTGKPTRQLVWTDRVGTAIATVPYAGEWGPPRIAPDGRRAMVGKIGEDDKTADLWLVENDGSAKLFSHTPGASEGCPIWSPDGSKIASWVSGKQEGNYDIYVRPVEGEGRPDLLFRSTFPKQPTDWSHDGRYIFFNGLSQATKYDVWAVSTADRHAGPILNTVNAESYAALSPDGKWLAYQSDESGRDEVYVQQFEGISSGTKRRWKITAGGGGLPRWRLDGKELFYLTASGRVMAAAIHATADDFEFDTPVKLFQTHPIRKIWNLYDAAPDGQRFLINEPLEWANSSQITVVTNWTEKLKE